VPGAVPWFALLVALIGTVHFATREGGGASMRQNAQLFGGAIAAAIGVGSCKIPKHLLKTT